MQILKDYVIVRQPDPFTEKKGNIWTPRGRWDTLENARLWGIVESLPKGLSQDFVTQHGETPVMMNDIEPVVKSGDKIWFHHRYLGEQDRYKVGVDLYKVNYSHIYAIERDAELIPVASHVLLHPEQESWEDITTAGGIITKTAPDKKYLVGQVAWIGAPFRSLDPLQVEPGDRVLIRRHQDLTRTIAGTEYYITRQHMLLAKLSKDAEVKVNVVKHRSKTFDAGFA